MKNMVVPDFHDRRNIVSSRINKAIGIVGPTSSGKSELAIRLAQKFEGEIISADSRQVYKKLDIGSGKLEVRKRRNIPHYLLDVASPRRQFTAAQFQRLANIKLAGIARRGHLPILVGGTGLYVEAVVKNLALPQVKPNLKLRHELEKLTPPELFARLKKLDPARAKAIDRHNPRRLIRAIEVALSGGRPSRISRGSPSGTAWLKIGIKTDPVILRKEIDRRVEKRLRRGLVSEVKKLRADGIGWQRLNELGLEYRLVASHLRGEITKPEMIEKMKIENWKLAKRQLTWFRRDPEIKWVENYKEAAKLTLDFLKK